MTPRWLGLALYAEGPTDHRFLDELLRRLVEHSLTRGGHSVELGQMQRLPVDKKVVSRADRIATGAALIQGAFHILFVHADGAGDTRRAQLERTAPGIDAMLAQLGSDARCGVPVIPVRETEAWALADYDRLREALGTKKAVEDLGLPSTAASLEREADPKALLDLVVANARAGRSGRRRPRAAAYLDLLGEQVRISECMQLSAFRSLVTDVEAALVHLGFRT